MEKKENLLPVIKWVGGKRQLLPEINKLTKKAGDINRFYEPFVGAGAVFLSNQYENVTINDINSELINLYKTIQEKPEEIIKDLKNHMNTKEYYYQIRNIDRSDEYQNFSNVQKASRFIYLNKAGYSGLYRVNKKNQFNVPYGDYKSLNFNEENILKVSKYLNESNIKIYNKNFLDLINEITEGDLVYLDPPYIPLNKTSNFTGYTKDGFSNKDQESLAEFCKEINNKNAKFILSNSNHPDIYKLYDGFKIKKVNANRTINSKMDKRGKIKEVLVYNF